MRPGLLAAIPAGIVLSWSAQAQETSGPPAPHDVLPAQVGGTDPAGPSAPAEKPDFFASLFAPSRSTLLGDMGGLRTAIGRYGLSFGLQETDEVFGNLTGGVHTGFAYDGLTEMSLGLDTQKAFGWSGGTFNVSALQIHGRSLSADNLDTLQTASGIEADRSTRLWELWFQQAVMDGLADIKIGQQSIDQEFMVSGYSSLFINTAMGWPVLPSFDLYAGGPAYPLSSLGVRVRAHPTDSLTVLAGVFDDNPPGGPFNDDSQLRGREAAGLAFNLNTGALWIAELQYARNQPAVGQMVAPNAPPSGLPGTYKLGVWYDSGSFPDQTYDTEGVSLASPLSNGMPLMHHGNFGLYAVADQMVWRPDPQGPRSVGLFARIMGSPADRNLISFSANAGVVVKAPFAGRDDDSAGFGFGVAKVSGAAALLDEQTGFYTGTAYPVRTVETFFEATYQYQAAPWWQVQPDLQYVIRPGGGIPNPLQPGTRIGNELVLGVRSVIVF